MATTTSMMHPCHVSHKHHHPLHAPTDTIRSSIPLSQQPPQPSISMPRATAQTNCATLASMWREIQGGYDWDQLIHPLNPLLRQEILRYGGFVAACYNAFDLNSTSKRYLNFKYGKKSMLAQVGMEDCGYTVTKYIYATPDIDIPAAQGCSRWIGYVAVSSDDQVTKLGRRDVLVSFRGTVTAAEWAANLMSSLTPARLDPHNPRPDIKVESGFLNLYTSGDRSCKFSHGSCRQQVLCEISRLIAEYGGEEMSITLAGHSMGSSLAILLGYDVAELGMNFSRSRHEEVRIPITVYSFGGPRVGNTRFKERCEELGVKVLRVANVKDPVTKMPGVIFNEGARFLGGRYEMPWSCACYAHVGVELALDSIKMRSLRCVHDLETYLALLKCPKKVDDGRKRRVDVVAKEREMMNAKKMMDAWHWRDAAMHVGTLVQSLGF